MAIRSEALEPKQARSRATHDRLLDAAAEELMECGYAGLTVQRIATRAGVSRGAAQNHFPQRSTMLSEAIQHLGRIQIAELHSRFEAKSNGAARLRAALDAIFDQYSSGRFAAIIEVSLAARHEAELHEVVTTEERAIASELASVAEALFHPDELKRAAPLWATALSAIRGVALLKIFGHPTASVHRQWRATRGHLIDLLSQTDARYS